MYVNFSQTLEMNAIQIKSGFGHMEPKNDIKL